MNHKISHVALLLSTVWMPYGLSMETARQNSLVEMAEQDPALKKGLMEFVHTANLLVLVKENPNNYQCLTPGDQLLVRKYVEPGRILTPKEKLLEASKKGDPQLLRQALDEQADLEVRCNGMTPLMLAIVNSHPTIAHKLVTAGANVQVFDVSGAANNYTALYYALEKNYPNLIKRFIEKVRKQKGDHEVCRYVTESTGDSLSCGFYPLHWATLYCTAALKTLAAAGADVNGWQRYTGIRPFHVAAQYSNPVAMRTLLKLGADTRFREKEGKTAFDIAQAVLNKAKESPKQCPAGEAKNVAHQHPTFNRAKIEAIYATYLGTLIHDARTCVKILQNKEREQAYADIHTLFTPARKQSHHQ